jgi:hypothetical protein
MSLLSWLFPSKPKASARHAAAPTQSHAVAAADGPKGERTQRREHLYLAVRDTMVRSGVLSSGYKFKVLSLDADGRQFLVMLDIAPGYGADTARQAEMEQLLMRTAKTRFHVEVTAVYWRLNGALASVDKPGFLAPAVAQAPVAPAARETPAPAPAALPVAAPTMAAPPSVESDFEPIAPDEVEAFKQALKKAAPPHAVAAPTYPRPHVEEGNAAGNGFADTMIVDQEERASRLGATQYGELH